MMQDKLVFYVDQKVCNRQAIVPDGCRTVSLERLSRDADSSADIEAAQVYKQSRASSLGPQPIRALIEARNVYLLHPEYAPWVMTSSKNAHSFPTAPMMIRLTRRHRYCCAGTWFQASKPVSIAISILSGPARIDSSGLEVPVLPGASP
jgi:hypothetical protein